VPGCEQQIRGANAGAPMTMIQAVLFAITEAFVLGILLALLLRWDETGFDEDEKADWQNRY
jgi:hypothetical protein